MSTEDSPPPALPSQNPPDTMRPLLATLLSVALALFLADAVASLLGDSLLLLTGNRALSVVAGIVAIPTLLMALLVYLLMALTPMIPKRLFLPLTLFGPVASLIALPLLIHFYQNIAWIAWGISLCHVVLCLAILRGMQGSWKFRWPWISAGRLNPCGFRWGNLVGFVAANLLVALPVVVIYLGFCTSLAVNHFSDGFVSLRPSGVTMQVRKYARDDGKTVELVPMSHIGEPEFYHALAASFPATATLLMEGVSDHDNLLPEKVSYRQTAKSLGLAEQQEVFKPGGRLVPADGDINQFSKGTVDFLKRTLGVHAKGADAGTLPLFVESPAPDILQQLLNDLLINRNRHLLTVLDEQLPQSDHIIIPWGAAHMPGIAQGVLKAGFTLQDTEDLVAIRFPGAKGK